MSKPHSDAVPRDRGCNLAPACLSCPLPQCKHDISAAMKYQAASIAREDEAKRLKMESYTISQIAFMFSLTKRSIHRILATNHD